MGGHHETPSNTDSLSPIPQQSRVFGGISYVLMWWSSLIVIQAFALGQAFLPPIGSLNLLQAGTVVVIAMVLFVVMFSLNGQAGMKYGIPYSIQVRSGFGTRGARIVELLRALPAIIWYGIGTWIAALSLNGILGEIIGFNPDWAPFLYFLGLQVLQSVLAYRGIRTMKWFNGIGSIVIAGIMLYMMLNILSTHGFKIEESWRHEGSWGTPFWVSLTAAIGVLATVMLNISDMSRHLKPSQKSLWLGHLLGVAPPWFFMLALGMVAGASLGIWDPVQALIQLSPSTGAMLLLLSFVLIAQITTNLTINILPPTLVFMEIFGVRWSSGVVITGVLGALSAPWLIMSNFNAFMAFILHYSAVFGPILGVMLADYFVRQKQTLNIEGLYQDDPSSPYWGFGGYNLAGLVAVFCTAAVTIMWFLPLSWIIGLPAGFVIYLLLPQIKPKAAGG